MSTRCNMVHVIGFDPTKVSGPITDCLAYDLYDGRYYNRVFLDTFGKIVTKALGYDKRTLEYLRSTSPLNRAKVSDIICPGFGDHDDIIGMVPVHNFSGTRLENYNDDFTWAMVEAGVFDRTQFIKIPYKDLSKYRNIPIDKCPIWDDELTLNPYAELRYAQFGKSLLRKYPNSELSRWDIDFQITKEVFKKLGYDIDYKDLDRYLVFYWS